MFRTCWYGNYLCVSNRISPRCSGRFLDFNQLALHIARRATVVLKQLFSRVPSLRFGACPLGPDSLSDGGGSSVLASPAFPEFEANCQEGIEGIRTDCRESDVHPSFLCSGSRVPSGRVVHASRALLQRKNIVY